MSYPNAQGNHKTEFAIIGDDYFDDGRVIAWRCLLIENGRIVAENALFCGNRAFDGYNAPSLFRAMRLALPFASHGRRNLSSR